MTGCLCYPPRCGMALQERHEEHRLLEPSYPDELFDELSSCGDLLAKGPRRSMCRFGSISTVLDHLLGIWFARALTWVYIGVVNGYLRSLGDGFNIELAGLDQQSPGNTQAWQQERKQAIATTRGSNKNTIHFATRVMIDPYWHKKARIESYKVCVG